MVVIIVFGIPGSGKTTYAHTLQAHCQSLGINCELISFDDMSVNKVWDEGSFHAWRESSLKAIATSIPVIHAMPTESIHTLSVTIVDDIMHLRSMRREVYVLARDRRVPVITVWINTAIDTALARNSLRTGRERIDEDAIRRIHAALQPPDPVHIFDRCSFTVDGNSFRHMGSMNEILELAGQLWDRAVVSPPSISKPDQSTSGESIAKDLDLALRAIVAAGMTTNKQHSAVDNKALGKAFAEAKTDVLKAARQHDRTSTMQGCKTALIKDYCLQFVATVQQSLLIGRADQEPQGILEHLVEFVNNHHK